MKQLLPFTFAVCSFVLPAAQAQESLTGLTQSSAPGSTVLTPIEGYIQNTGVARPTGAVQVYTRASTYSWQAAASQWSTSVSIQEFTYNAQAQVVQQMKIDSVKQQPVYKYTYFYNTAGQRTSTIFELWTNSTWQNSTRYVLTYDNSGRITEELTQMWSGGVWENYGRYQYAYDAQGNKTLDAYQSWTGNAWVTSSGRQFSYVYDVQSRKTEQVESLWNSAAASYQPISRYQYSYTGTAATYSSYIYQSWNNSAWANSEKINALTYDAQNQITYYEQEAWTGGAWQLGYRNTIVYGISGSYVQVAEALSNGIWTNYSRRNVEYDASGNYLGNSTEAWVNSAWQLNVGTNYTLGYDASGNVIRRLVRTVNATTHAWTNSGKFYYGPYISITLGSRPANSLARQSLLYPNPTTGATMLTVAGLRPQGPIAATLTNTLGQTVQKLTSRPQGGTVEQPLNLEALPAGVYLLTLHAAEGTVTKRVVKN